MDGQKCGDDFHSEEHQDCLVGGGSGGQDFKRKAYNYIQAILPCEVFCIPGLSMKNISYYDIPVGFAKGKTVKQVLLLFKDHKISASIFGCNDPGFFTKEKEIALRKYLDVVGSLYQNTNFKVVFLTTVFARRSEMKKHSVFSGRKRFNDFMLKQVGNPDYDIFIRNGDGVRCKLEWRVVDMTDIIRASELDDEKYFCGSKRRSDGIHFNSIYLEHYLKRLADMVKLYDPPKPALANTVVSHETPKPRKRSVHRMDSAQIARLFGLIDMSDI